MLFTVAAAIGYTAERNQRQRAEETTDLALEALDRIFDKFAPGDSIATSNTSLTGDDGPTAGRAVLSPEAARLLAGMLEFYERLASQSDDDSELLRKCAQARQRVGDIYQRLGNYDAAIASYQLAIADYGNLAAQANADSYDSSVIIKAGLLNGIGACQLMLAQQEESQTSHQTAMTLLEGLSAEAQRLPDVRYEKARTHSLLARRLRPGESMTSQQFIEIGRDHERRNDFRPDLDPEERIRPENNRRPVRLPPGRHGDFSLEGQRPEDNQKRRQHFSDAIALLEELATEAPDVARYRFLLALCLRENSQHGDGEMAPELNRACRLLEALVDQYADRPEYRLALAESYAQVEGGPNNHQPADARQAETSLAMAAEHARQLVEEHPTVPAYTNSLVHICGRLASVQERRAQNAFGQEYRSLMSEAERNLRSALELQESLIRREPNITAYHLWAARFRNSISRMLRQQGRMDESRQMSEYAIERLADCPTSSGDLATCAEILGQLYQSLGTTLRNMGQVEDAIDAMLTAEEQFDLAAAERMKQQPE